MLVSLYHFNCLAVFLRITLVHNFIQIQSKRKSHLLSGITCKFMVVSRKCPGKRFKIANLYWTNASAFGQSAFSVQCNSWSRSNNSPEHSCLLSNEKRFLLEPFKHVGEVGFIDRFDSIVLLCF